MSARKLREKQLLKEKFAQLPHKRMKKFKEDISEAYESDDEPSFAYQTPSRSQNKRQKKEETVRSRQLPEKQIGADNISPAQMSSTKQDEEENEQVLNTGSKSTKVTSICSTFSQSHQIIQDSNQKEIEEEKDEKPQNQQSPEAPAQTEAQYLNLQNLQKLERISQCKKLNFDSLISDMIKAEGKADLAGLDLDIFKTKTYLQIDQLQSHSLHIQKNKLSDKFNRRDVQFYDLYIKKDSGEELAKLRDNQFPLEIDAEHIYNELEVEDFNKLFINQTLIEDKFGSSVQVQVSINKKEEKLARFVKELPDLVKIYDKSEFTPQKSKPSQKPIEIFDPELINFDQQIKQFVREYGKTYEEVVDIFCKCSGRMNKMREYFNGQTIIEWNFLEDLALQKAEDSPEFKLLLFTKGWDEIRIRRDFLQATPVINEEEVEKKDEQLQQ